MVSRVGKRRCSDGFHHHLSHLRLLGAVTAATVLIFCHGVNAWKDSTADFLAKGDAALSENKVKESIDLYNDGILLLPPRWSGKEAGEDEEELSNVDDQSLLDESEISLIMSLHTNYATALSYLNGSNEQVLRAYRAACLCYRMWKQQMEAQSQESDKDGFDVPKNIKAIATQAYFFLGMTQQDLASTAEGKEQQEEMLQYAARSYGAATRIDPKHWSSFANMAVVLGDVGENAISLELYEEAILSYQRAIDILTGVHGKDDPEDKGPTDPPENVREVVAELNYRIGLSLVPILFNPSKEEEDNEDQNDQKCTLNIGPKATPTTRSCLELSAYQFNSALQYNPRHDGAHTALNFVTADAIFGMSTDVKNVQKLFQDYASTFEHSLVDELGYDGFSRMRGGFDRAMLAEGRTKDMKFPLVVDAGCGTGLAGEVFRNISQTLVGVDLSPAIINLAQESRPNLYDEFKIGDVKEILHEYAKQEQQISLLVAADTFIYFNDLNELFASIKAGLQEGGYVIFSLENVSNENERTLNQVKPDWRWQLTPSGRVAHRKQFVEATAAKHSLNVILYETLDNFREESGRGVRGHMFVLKKDTGVKDEL